MKKLFALTLLCTAISFCFLSCSEDDDYPSIIGSWSEFSETTGEYISMKTELIWTFKENNTASERFILMVNNVTSADVTKTFTYQYDGKTIKFAGGESYFEYEVYVSGNKMKLGSEEDGYFELTKK